MKLFGRKKKTKEKKEDRRINQQLLKLREQTASELAQILEEDSKEQKKEQDQSSSAQRQAKKVGIERKKINYKNRKECLDYASEQCELMSMSQKQLTESKVEYNAVSEYLTDIQKIDQIPEDSRKKINESARRIMNLSFERERFQKRDSKITDQQFKHFEKYEDTIPAEIKKMQQNEDYEQLIKNDLKNLEGEKAVLLYEREALDQKKSYIQCIAVIASVLLGILFLMFGLLQSKLEMDLKTPTLLAVLLGIIVVFIVFMESNKTNAGIRLNERKLNKAVGLMNKVKIKYVNNRNNLDYTYEKYRVHAAKEFAYLWEQYVKLKDEMRRYQENTELLEYYRKALVTVLEDYGITDAQVWPYQPMALVDAREMVEVRHRLNERRQKLRNQIEYNNEVIASGREEINKIIQNARELEYEIHKMKEKAHLNF